MMQLTSKQHAYTMRGSPSAARVTHCGTVPRGAGSDPLSGCYAHRSRVWNFAASGIDGADDEARNG